MSVGDHLDSIVYVERHWLKLVVPVSVYGSWEAEHDTQAFMVSALDADVTPPL